MSEQNYKMQIDPLALGLTRQATFMGVNVKVFFANILLCFLICIYAHTILGIPLFFVLHLTFAKLSIKEPNFIYLYFKVLTKTPPNFNYQFWNGQSHGCNCNGLVDCY